MTDPHDVEYVLANRHCFLVAVRGGPSGGDDWDRLRAPARCWEVVVKQRERE